MADPFTAYECLQTELLDDGVLRLWISDLDQMVTHRELSRVWRTIDDADDVRSVLFTGTHHRAPDAAEGDRGVGQFAASSQENRVRLFRQHREIVFGILDCTKPVVSALSGDIVRDDLFVGLLADISVVARTAVIHDSHTQIGLVAGDHAIFLWPLLIGLAKTRYHLLLGEPILGEAAEQMGLVSLAVDEADVEATGLDIAQRLAAGPAIAISLTKHAINNWLRAATPVFDASLSFESLTLGGADFIDARRLRGGGHPPADG